MFFLLSAPPATLFKWHLTYILLSLSLVRSHIVKTCMAHLFGDDLVVVPQTFHVHNITCTFTTIATCWVKFSQPMAASFIMTPCAICKKTFPVLCISRTWLYFHVTFTYTVEVKCLHSSKLNSTQMLPNNYFVKSIISIRGYFKIIAKRQIYFSFYLLYKFFSGSKITYTLYNLVALPFNYLNLTQTLWVAFDKLLKKLCQDFSYSSGQNWCNSARIVVGQSGFFFFFFFSPQIFYGIQVRMHFQYFQCYI